MKLINVCANKLSLLPALVCEQYSQRAVANAEQVREEALSSI